MPSRPESRAGEGDLEPLALLADQPVGGDADVVEVHRRGGRAGEPHLLLRRVGRQAGGVGRHQEARDPVASVAGAGHHLVEVGEAAVRRPGLGALDHPLVAVAPGGGPHRGRVGAGVRLGEAVRAEQLAAEHVRQPALPLLLGAVGGQAEAGQRVHGDADADRGPDRADLLEHLEVDLVGHPAAAVLLGVGQPQQPGPAELEEDVAREGPVGLGGDRPLGAARRPRSAGPARAGRRSPRWAARGGRSHSHSSWMSEHRHPPTLLAVPETEPETEPEIRVDVDDEDDADDQPLRWYVIAAFMLAVVAGFGLAVLLTGDLVQRLPRGHRHRQSTSFAGDSTRATLCESGHGAAGLLIPRRVARRSCRSRPWPSRGGAAGGSRRCCSPRCS